MAAAITVNYDEDNFEEEEEVEKGTKPEPSPELLQPIKIPSPKTPKTNVRTPLAILTEIQLSSLLSYLGFARYGQLFLAKGVNGMDLANSKDADLQAVGVGFKPHRTRLLKTIKAVRHAGVDFSKFTVSSHAFMKRPSSPASPLPFDFQIQNESDFTKFAAAAFIQASWRRYAIELKTFWMKMDKHSQGVQLAAATKLQRR